jgi:hypothetical protein
VLHTTISSDQGAGTGTGNNADALGGDLSAITHRMVALQAQQVALQQQQAENVARITDRQVDVALRTPSPLESFAVSIGSSALGVMLGGVLLIIIADAIDLIPRINWWPLVTLSLAIVAVAAISLTGGRRHRVERLLGTSDSSSVVERKVDSLAQQVAALAAVQAGTPARRGDNEEG